MSLSATCGIQGNWYLSPAMLLLYLWQPVECGWHADIYIFIYFIGGVERITPFCCLTVKWVTVLYGGRKMYRIITVSCVDKAGQS